MKARLFEPFFTTRSTAHRSGLGLATSYGIVRQSGGCICAESALGQGTTLRIYLPRVACAAGADLQKRRDPAKLLTGTETVLVLEDEVGVRHLSVRVLRKLGYEVLEAAHGDDAKRLIAQQVAEDRSATHRHDDAGNQRPQFCRLASPNESADKRPFRFRLPRRIDGAPRPARSGNAFPAEAVQRRTTRGTKCARCSTHES